MRYPRFSSFYEFLPEKLSFCPQHWDTYSNVRWSRIILSHLLLLFPTLLRFQNDHDRCLIGRCSRDCILACFVNEITFHAVWIFLFLPIPSRKLPYPPFLDVFKNWTTHFTRASAILAVIARNRFSISVILTKLFVALPSPSKVLHTSFGLRRKSAVYGLFCFHTRFSILGGSICDFANMGKLWK